MIEIILCKCFPTVAIKKDISVGLAQIKISTAQDILRQSPFIFINKLTDTEFNISVCAKYLRKLKMKYDSFDDDRKQDYNDLYIYISTEYLDGTAYSKDKTILVYSAILREKCKDGFEYIAENTNYKIL